MTPSVRHRAIEVHYYYYYYYDRGYRTWGGRKGFRRLFERRVTTYDSVDRFDDGPTLTPSIPISPLCPMEREREREKEREREREREREKERERDREGGK